MRNGFNGLAAKVQTTLKDDPMSGHVFIFRAAAAVRLNFCGPPATGCAADQTAGARRFAWPSARDGKVFLTPAQLAMLLEGIDWRQPKRPDLLTMLWFSLSWLSQNKPGMLAYE
jgi:transposase